MNNYLEKVKEFHNTFGAPVLETPQIPEKDRSDLRVSLIQEELNELKTAISENNLTEIADACGDLMVVLSGTILEFGLGDKFDEIFDIIHKSNMSKACKTEDVAKRTMEFYNQKDGTESYSKLVNGKWIVYRLSDNKVLKSVEYTPANIKV
jgi:predicted HAD superfamily Cof-like phosphohydrolase